jgi:small-conductance mechanosensitive channel
LEKIILKVVQRHTEEKRLLNASQFGFHACHSTTLQSMRLMNHVTLNFNNISMAALFLDNKKAFEATWHLGLLCNLLELKFLISLIKLISSFFSLSEKIQSFGQR